MSAELLAHLLPSREPEESGARLLVASSRLPLTLRTDRGAVELVPSSYGVATGLRGLHARSRALWFGWHGHTAPLDGRQRAELERRTAATRTVPMSLTPDEIARFYEGYANRVLWPLFHHITSALPVSGEDFAAYRQVNERFADALAERYRPGDTVWVHDYQLMLVPELLRRRVGSQARIGFFLHVPFPPADLFATLAARRDLLEGMLGADLIGFHTGGYVHHFSTAVKRELGLRIRDGAMQLGDRTVRVGMFPMGIDAGRYAALAAEPRVRARVARWREGPRRALFVGIDRLDYTKGLPHRLLAFEAMLRKHPELIGTSELVQVAVPTRTAMSAYRAVQQEVREIVARVNAELGHEGWQPIRLIEQGISEREIVALYRAADVMLVTPIRDGMNLVAKEFVASRVDGGGVLVLSEFAGAACELAEAVQVNPFDIEMCADAYHEALGMPQEERVRRMRILRARVAANTVDRWSERFLDSLANAG